MLPYILLLLAIGIPSLLRLKKITQSQSVYLVLSLVFFIGFRQEIGVDWEQYMYIFERFGYQTLDYIFETNEPLYFFINWLSVNLNQGIVFVNTICALIFSYGLIKYCRKQPLPWLGLFISIPIFIIMVSLGYTRQSAAIGLGILSLYYLETGYISLSVLSLLFASLLHLPVVMMSVIHIVAFRKHLSKTRYLIPLLIISPLVVVLLANRLVESYIGISVNYSAMTGSFTGSLYRLFPSIFASAIILFNQNKFKDFEPKLKVEIYIITAISLFILLAIFFIVPGARVGVDRLSLYFAPITIYVYSRLPLLRLYRMGHYTWTILLIASYSLYTICWLLFSNHSFAFVPYSNYLFSEPTRLL